MKPSAPLLGERVTGSRRIAAIAATAVLIALGAPAAATAAGGCRGANVRPSAGNLNLVRAATLCLIDRTRASVGERPLRANAALRAVAAHQLADMISYDYFSDVPPTGQSLGALVSAARYAPRARAVAGEDIAWATGSRSTPAQILAAWLRSAPHRAILLDPRFHDAGVGVIAAAPRALSGGRRAATYAIDLGERLP